MMPAAFPAFEWSWSRRAGDVRRGSGVEGRRTLAPHERCGQHMGLARCTPLRRCPIGPVDCGRIVPTQPRSSDENDFRRAYPPTSAAKSLDTYGVGCSNAVTETELGGRQSLRSLDGTVTDFDHVLYPAAWTVTKKVPSTNATTTG